MILGMEIGLLIAGIIALATGKMKLSKTKAAVGAPARIAGIIAILPLPLSFMVGVAIGAASVAQGRSVDDIKWTATAIEIAILLACLTASLIIAYAKAQPIEPPSPPRPAQPPQQTPPLPPPMR